MKTLEQHNQEVVELRQARMILLTAGILCDKCGTELCYQSESNRATGHGSVKCPKCGFKGYKDAP